MNIDRGASWPAAIRLLVVISIQRRPTHDLTRATADHIGCTKVWPLSRSSVSLRSVVGAAEFGVLRAAV